MKCSTGTDQSKCYKTVAGGNAVTSGFAEAFGEADAYSNHQYRVGDDYTAMDQQSIVLTASGPDPEEQCEDGGHYWDPLTETCEFNPDGPSSPIVIATGKRNDFKFTSAADGVLFDIDADGIPDRVAWTAPDSELAFLAVDRDGDGRITSGRELFGNFTYRGVSSGFAALRQMNKETNGGVARGSVSADDPLFFRLLLWRDANHNGISEPGELSPVADLVSDIGLGQSVHNRRDGHGNLFRYRGWIHLRTRPGRNKAASPEDDVARRRDIYDVFLVRQ